MTEQEAYLQVVEGWLRDNRGITHPAGSIDDLQRRIAASFSKIEAERDKWRKCAFAAMPSAD